MGQKIIFQLVVEDAGLTARIEQLRASIRGLNKDIRANPGPEEMNALAAQLAKAKRELADLVKEQKDLNREFAALKVPADSLAGLRLEYARLAKEIAQLTEAERKSEFGKSIIKNAASVKAKIDGIEQSIGRFTGNVGNYRAAFTSLFDIAGGVLLAGGISNGVQLITNTINKGIDAVEEYGVAFSRLSAITGVTGKDLEDLRQKAQELTTIKVGDFEITNTAKDIFDAFTLVGSARPELLQDSDALKDVAKQAIVLSKASGDDLKTSVEAVTTELGQFKLNASESRRVINELAAGSKEGASEITDTTQALQKFGTTAANNNISTAESVALIETLADRQLKGAEAGTQLRNILAKLAGADIIPAKGLKQLQDAGVNINVLKDSSIPLIDRLKELSKVQGNTSALAKVFGLENLQAAQIITEGLPKYEDLLQKIQGTDEAYKQAAINADNFQTRLDNLKTKGVNVLVNAFLGLEPAINSGVELISGFVDLLVQMGQIVTDNSAEFAALSIALLGVATPLGVTSAGFLELVASTNLSSVAAIKQTAATAAQTISTEANTLATRALSAAQAAMPLLALVAGIYLVVKAFDVYNENLSAAEKASRSVADAQNEIAESSGKEIANLNANIEVLKNSASSQEARAKAIKALTDQYPEYLKGLNLETATVFQLTQIQKGLTAEIIRGAAERAKANAQNEIATKIVAQELKIQELQTKKAQGGFSFKDLDFQIQNEQLKLKGLQKELEITGQKFDDTFGINKPIFNPTQNVLGVDTSLIDQGAGKKQIDIRRATIEELKKLDNQAARDELERRKKLGEDENKLTEKQQKAAEREAAARLKADQDSAKALEDQQKRLIEIKRAIRELDGKEQNQFDQQLSENEEKRLAALEKNAERLRVLREKIAKETNTVITPAKEGQTAVQQVSNIKGSSATDKTEAGLIDAETKAINEAFDRQKIEIETKRAEVREAQIVALNKLGFEVAKIGSDNAVKIAEAAKKTFDAAFAQRRNELNQEFAAREQTLKQGLISGDIKPKQATDTRLANQAEFNARSLALEKEYAEQSIAVTNQIRDAKIEAAKVALQSALFAIEQQRKADVADLEKQGKAQGIDTGGQISEINQRAAEAAKAAQLDYTNAVVDSTQAATDAQLAGIQSVDAANEQASADQLARIEKEKDMRQRIKEAVINGIGDLSEKLIGLEQKQIEQKRDLQLAALDEEYSKKLKAAQGNTKLEAALQKELAEKQEKIRKDAAEKNKKLAIISAIINTAVGITKAFDNPFPLSIILAALVAASGAIQIAEIQSQQLAFGGFAKSDERRETQQPGSAGQSQRVGPKTAVYPKRVYDALPDYSERGGFTGPGLNYRDQTGHKVAGKLSKSKAVVHGGGKRGEYVAPTWQVDAEPHVFNIIEYARASGQRISDLLGLSEDRKGIRTFADGGFAASDGRTVPVAPFSGGGFSLSKLDNFIYLKPFAGGGFSDPVIGLPNSSQLQQQTVSVQATATFSDEQVKQIGQIIAAENAAVTRQALADGLGDANRRLERQQSLEQQRKI